MSDRVKIYMTLNAVDYALGVFLLCSPSRNIDEIGFVSREVDCYSTLQILLDECITERYTIAAGTNVVNEVIRLIGPYAYSITASIKVLLTAKTYEIGTSKLVIINELLAIINYTSLYTDVNGTYKATPYVLPQDRTDYVVIEDNLVGLIKTEMTEELDLFNVPNVFVRYTNDINVNPPLSYTWTNSNTNSITSTVNRGRSIVNAEAVEATSYDDLVAITKKYADEANSVYSHLNFEMAIKSTLDFYLPCLWIKANDINDKYIAYNIEFTCGVGEQMKIKARKVVDLFE